METKLELLSKPKIAEITKISEDYSAKISDMTDKIEKCIYESNVHSVKIVMLRDIKSKLMDYKKVKKEAIKNCLLRDGVSLLALLFVESILPLTSPLINFGLLFITTVIIAADSFSNYNKTMKQYNEINKKFTIESINNEIFEAIAMVAKATEENNKYNKEKNQLERYRDQKFDNAKRLYAAVYYNKILRGSLNNTTFVKNNERFFASANESKKLIKTLRPTI